MNKFGQIFIKDKFLKVIICLIVLLICSLNSTVVYSQIYYYQDDSENPFQYYSSPNEYNYGNSAPNQYYYSSPDPDYLIDQINQLFKKMFGEKFDSDDDYTFSYPIPKQLQDRFGLLNKYNENNNGPNSIDPAPEYSQNPDIYY